MIRLIIFIIPPKPLKSLSTSSCRSSWRSQLRACVPILQESLDFVFVGDLVDQAELARSLGRVGPAVNRREHLVPIDLAGLAHTVHDLAQIIVEDLLHLVAEFLAHLRADERLGRRFVFADAEHVGLDVEPVQEVLEEGHLRRRPRIASSPDSGMTIWSQDVATR